MRDKIRLAWVQILRALYGESWKNDPNLIDSPDRIANSIVNERCSGINSEVECREILNSTFLSEYDGMVIISPIIVSSLCPHHFENINSRDILYKTIDTFWIYSQGKCSRIIETHKSDAINGSTTNFTRRLH